MAELEARSITTQVSRAEIEATIVRCPDGSDGARMIDLIDATRKAGDSVGGIIEAVARNVPAGLGEPVFDRLEADLGKAMLSLPAAKASKAAAALRARAYEDPSTTMPSTPPAVAVQTRTNRSGGIQGGISNGEDIIVRAAFKPTATILMPQETVDIERAQHDLASTRSSRSMRPAPGRAHGRGDDGPGPGRPLPAPARTVRRRPVPPDESAMKKTPVPTPSERPTTNLRVVPSVTAQMVAVPVEHLEVQIEGPVTETSIVHVFEQVRDEVARQVVKKVLIDLRQGSVSLTISDMHGLAKMIVQRFAGTIDKIAIVPRSEDIFHDKFLEPSLVNRGLPTLVTSDFEEAIDWLSSRLKQGR